jgi:hypothetical protein
MKAGGVPSKEMLAAVERAIREARENPILQSDLDTMFDELGDTEVEQLGPVQADELKNDALRQKEERDLQSGVSKLEWAFEDARSRSAAMTAPRGLGAAQASKSGASGRQAAVPATSATAAAQPAGAAALIEQAATHDGPGTAVPGGLSSGSGLHEPDETAQAAARAAAARVTAALRHEVVHANADQQGANVHAAADRRVTNTGTSSATAASPVPTRVYARSRADRAAAVPEARRGLVRQYFSREGGEPAAGGQ